jgi:hypothetical protein
MTKRIADNRVGGRTPSGGDLPNAAVEFDTQVEAATHVECVWMVHPNARMFRQPMLFKVANQVSGE